MKKLKLSKTNQIKEKIIINSIEFEGGGD